MKRNDPDHLGRALYRLQFRTTIDENTGCWLYGGTPSDPYGHLTVHGDSDTVHRWSWRIYYGPIPPGRLVRRTCGSSRCWNPDHLKLSSGRRTKKHTTTEHEGSSVDGNTGD